jgi:hypothetical protein
MAGAGMTTSAVSTIIAERQRGQHRAAMKGEAIRGIADGSLFIWIGRASPTLTLQSPWGRANQPSPTKYLSEAQGN